jgi:hypothetical protein
MHGGVLGGMDRTETRVGIAGIAGGARGIQSGEVTETHSVRPTGADAEMGPVACRHVWPAGGL